MDTSAVRRFSTWIAQSRPQGRPAKLWHRIGYGFAALLVLMAGLLVVAVLQFRSLAQHGERMLQVDFQRMLSVQAVHQHAQGHGIAMARLLTSRRDDRVPVYALADSEYRQVDQILVKLKKQVDQKETLSLLDVVAQRREQYRNVFIEVVSNIEADDLVLASTLFNGPGLVALNHLLDASEALLAHERAGLARRQAAVSAKIVRSELILATGAFAALLISALLAWRITASIAKPLARIEASAGAIAQGEYTSPIDIRGGAEITRVAHAINKMAIAVAVREREIERLAYVDRLTGLPNRNGLMRAAETGNWTSPSVIHIDLARLRSVNEVLGFGAGDDILMQLADRLRSQEQLLQFSLARLEGGVFVCVSDGLPRQAVESLRGRLDSSLAGSMVCANQTIDVRLIYGLSVHEAQTPASLEVLLREAEQAASEAKRQQQLWRWHTKGDAPARARQLGLLWGLEMAAACGQLEMWLQPKVDVASNDIAGVEALVRWRHPEWGFVAPSEFIPFAEQTGHIGVVTQALLEQAMATLGRWTRVHPKLSIAVNVSALDVRDSSLPKRLEAMASLYQAPLDRLKLEITESGVMANADSVLPVLHALRTLGVKLSIDDFGTGYSSLAYLQRLPVSELKIDRSFVSHADEKQEAVALLRAIIELGHSLRLTLVAEGVERPEEKLLLERLGCDQLQGYLIGKPMPLAELELQLASWRGLVR